MSGFLIPTLGAYVLGKLFDKGLKLVEGALKVDAEGLLNQIIQNTVREYETSYGFEDTKDGYGFWKSKEIVAELINYTLFSDEKLDISQILKHIQKNSHVIQPTKEQFQLFVDIFIKNIEKDKKFEELFIEENHKREIYNNAFRLKNLSEQQNDIQDTLNSICDRITVTDQNSQIKFEDYINKLPAPVRCDNEGSNLYYYKSQQLPYVRRPKEEKQLDDFRNRNAMFQWWAITGQGGSGKSKLAFEYALANDNKNNWCIRYIEWDKHKPLDIEDYNYHENVLFILDYVPAFAKEVGQWIDQLNTRVSVNKIRVLILERNTITIAEDGEPQYPQWYTQFIEGCDDSGGNLRQHLFKDFLELNTDESLINAIVLNYIEVGGKENRPDKAPPIILETLRRIDENFQRPLYALFITDAWLKEKDNLRLWDKNTLNSWVNDNEIKKIRTALSINGEVNAEVVNAAKYLLAFATVVNSLDLSKAAEKFEVIQTNVDILEKHATDNDLSLSDVFSSLGSISPSDDYFGLPILNALVPDIMGEYFVLFFLKNRKVFNDERFKEFVQMAWEYNPLETARFMYRLTDDYLEDPLSKSMYFLEPENEDITIKGLFSIVIFSITPSTNPSLVTKAIFKLSELAKCYPKFQEIQVAYAKGLVNLSAGQDLPEAYGTIEKLESLSSNYPKSQEIQVEYASGLFNLSNKQDLSGRSSTIEKLESLSSNYPKSQEIQVEYAKGLVNLSAEQDLSGRSSTIEKLESLSSNYPKSQEIQVEYASGLFNLSAGQDLPEVYGTIEKLESLSSNYPKSQEIQVEYAKGLVNLSNKQDLPEAYGTIEKLESLSSNYPKSQEIQVAYAKGLVNLSAEQDLSGRSSTIEKLESLSSNYPKSQEIQVEYAKGLVNLSAEQDLPEAYGTLDKLRILTERFLDDVEVQTIYSAGLAMISSEEQMPEIFDTIDKLKELANNHPDVEMIHQAYEYGLKNLGKL